MGTQKQNGQTEEENEQRRRVAARRLAVRFLRRDGFDHAALSEASAQFQDVRPSVVADALAHVEERNGLPVIVTDKPMAPMSVIEAREAIERVRR